MREFTRDEQATTISPSSMFKSSFAREVVQNVRRSMSSVNQDSLLGSSNINSRTAEDVATVALNNSIRNSIVSSATASLKASSSSASASSSSADDKGGGGGARTKSVRK